MCKNCYHRIGRDKKAYKCSHPNRALYALGMCKHCYQLNYAKKKKAINKKQRRKRKKEDDVSESLLISRKESESLNSEIIIKFPCKKEKTVKSKNHNQTMMNNDFFISNFNNENISLANSSEQSNKIKNKNDCSTISNYSNLFNFG
jgi:hypothetical protein